MTRENYDFVGWEGIMKTLICGSRIIKNKGKNWEIPNVVKESLDLLISNNDEVLIGDSSGIDSYVQYYLYKAGYTNVCVYTSGNVMKSNVGKWPEKRISGNGDNKNAQHLEKIFHMSEETELGLAIWDGGDIETFICILCLAVLRKRCRLYLINENKWQEIASVEDLERFAGNEGKISDDDMVFMLKKCGFSDEMTYFITSDEGISPYYLARIVCMAPITLDEKTQLISKLLARQNKKYDTFNSVIENVNRKRSFKQIKYDIREIMDYRVKQSMWTYFWNLYREICQAKEFMYNHSDDMFCDGPSYLYTEWYDTEELMHKSSSCGLFMFCEDVEKYIKTEEAENGCPDELCNGYYRMEAWDTMDTGWNEPRYDYYYDCRGKVCWFEKLIPKKVDGENKYYLPESRQFTSGKLDISLRTPYKVGDIVHIDCRPFGPPFHAMILESRDQWDCCFPNIVFRIPGTDEWRLTPLKHRMFYKDHTWGTYEPMLSPLYRLRKVREDEFSADDHKLLDLSRMISGDENKAEAVWAAWGSESGRDVCWEKVLEIFNR